MSQKKVDEYKNYKKNRRENIKRKTQRASDYGSHVGRSCSVYRMCRRCDGRFLSGNALSVPEAALPTYGSTSFILSDMAGIQKEDTEDQTKRDSKRVRRGFIC